MLENYKDNNDSTTLIELLRKGDKVALETIFRLYYDKLLHLAKNYLTYEEDAEEIVQNIFLKIWEDPNKLRDVSNVNGYLYTMTKNSCMDHLKHEKVKRSYLDEKLQNKSSINYQFLQDDAASLLIEKELEQKILESAELLPNKCREVFMKSRMEGLKRSEIAQELGISLKTVDNHISKAIKHMKFQLRDFLVLFL